jgi:TolA-binding protein
MTASRTTTVVTLALLAMIASTTTAAYEIYHWLDENGVPNFSQKQPDGKTPGVSKLSLVDTTPPDYNPDEDRYGVQQQAERMNALREEMEQRRDAVRERQRDAAQQQIVQYREPVRRYSHGIWYPPIYPRPPYKPRPPIAVPYPTSTLEPPE